MPWIRLWTDTLDSPKIFGLSDDLFRGWTLILLATKKADRGGVVPSIETLAFWAHRDIETASRWVDGLIRAGFLERHDDLVTVHDWDYWQPPRDRTNAERQMRHRKDRKVSFPRPLSSKETDTETEAEGAKNVTARKRNAVTHPLPEVFAPNPAPAPPTSPLAWGPEQQKIVDLAAERWGASNGDSVVGGFLREYPAAWVKAACDRVWDKDGAELKPAYLRGILQAYQREGGPKQQAPFKGKGDVIPYKASQTIAYAARIPTEAEKQKQADDVARWRAENPDLVAKIGRKVGG
jgi:hypothetical protein